MLRWHCNTMGRFGRDRPACRDGTGQVDRSRRVSQFPCSQSVRTSTPTCRYIPAGGCCSSVETSGLFPRYALPARRIDVFGATRGTARTGSSSAALLRLRPRESGELLILAVFADIHHVHGQCRVIFATGLREVGQSERYPTTVSHTPAGRRRPCSPSARPFTCSPVSESVRKYDGMWRGACLVRGG